MFRPVREVPPPKGVRVFRLELDVFRGEPDRAHSERVLQLLLDALTQVNVEWMRAHPGVLPPLYQAGVVYTREPLGADERWQDCYSTWQRKRGDCEDLACWLAAELQVKGEEARAFATGRPGPTGGSLYHIRVKTPRGIYDPSRVLGMLAPDEGEVGRPPTPTAKGAFVPGG
jgi:hypothetical protein